MIISTIHQSTESLKDSHSEEGFEPGAFVKNIGFILVTVIGLTLAITFLAMLFLLQKRL
jgi:hypothetical protein